MVDTTDPSLPPVGSSAQNGTAENALASSSSSSATPDRNASTQDDSKTAASAQSSDAHAVIGTKRTYLSLLPQEQIIEICLLFEPHVPPNVRTSVWPADLKAAILELKEKAPFLNKSSKLPPQSNQNVHAPLVTPVANGVFQTSQNPTVTPTSTHQVHPPGFYASPAPPPDPIRVEVPPMGSLREEAKESAKAKASVPDSSVSSHALSPAPRTNGDSTSSTSQNTPCAAPPPHPSAAGSHSGTPQLGQPQQAILHPPAPYPYAHYGYAVPPQQAQQPAYPHAPYYPPPPAYPPHYSYPHYPHQPPPGYPPPPPGHTPPPPHPPGQLFSSQPLIRPPAHPPNPPPQPPPPSGEDLPSYEEMLVEALMDCGDAEGVAPKDLFTWMASRYPLQTNFRPSASQALQKAYKRGRFEKLAGGKYRLNPNWEGGATAKRTTRRPQTLAQTTYAMHHSPPPPPPPFTQAPLHQHNHPNNQLAHGQHPPPYNGYQYQYPYGHYAGYAQPHQQQQQQPQPVQEKRAEQAPSHPAPAASKAPAKPASEEKDEGDAWEAAQHILQAINFGNIASGGADASSDPHPGSSSGSGAVLPPSTADAGDIDAVLSALADAAAAASSAAEPRTTLTDDERASLQAQLALLAAQLTEIAEADEDEDEAPVPPLASAGPIVSTHSAQSPALPLRPAHGAPPESDRPVSQPPLVQPAPQSAPGPPKSVNLPPPPIAAYSGTHLSFDVNAFPEAFPSTAPTLANASGAQTDVSELGGEDSDDDDMEDVVVPLHGHDVLRT